MNIIRIIIKNIINIKKDIVVVINKILDYFNYRSNNKMLDCSNYRSNNELIIIPRSKHNISRKKICKCVLKVLYTLKTHGFESYLVGGGVRDLLLEKPPKDFDVVTNARPEQIKKLFKFCYIIGKRFQLVHVCFSKNIVEVATFRSDHYSSNSKEGMILRDNIYGNIEQDVLRRDFTINALYYNITDYSLVDYVGGLKDLQDKTINSIGDPTIKYRQDPVRMLRAIRFAAKLNFVIHPNTEQPIYHLGQLLLNISPARLYDEYVKLFFTGHPLESFILLNQYKLITVLFPSLSLHGTGIDNQMVMSFVNCILNSLVDLDSKILIPNELKPAYLLAGFLWNAVVKVAKNFKNDQRLSEYLSYKNSSEQLLREQSSIINIPKKMMSFIKDIWIFQLKLSKNLNKLGQRSEHFIASHKFAVAFKFLSLRAQSGDQRAQKIYRCWNKFLISRAQVK